MQEIFAAQRTIDIRLSNKEQLFSEYNYTDDNLNPELSTYLFEQAKLKMPLPKKENFVIKIHTNDPEINISETARCVHRHFHETYNATKNELQYLFGFTILMFCLGAAALVLQFLAKEFIDNFFLTEILNVAAWVFTWEGIDAMFLRRRELHKDAVVARCLAYAVIEITTNDKLPKPIYI